MKYPFLFELIIRLKTESPKTFKTLQKVFYTAAAVIELATLLKDCGVQFPVVIDSYITHSTAILLGSTGVIAQLPVDDTNALNDKISKKQENEKA